MTPFCCLFWLTIFILCLNLNFPVRLKVTKKAVIPHAEDNGLICSKKIKSYFSIAATPGSTLPSMASSMAPPPVET